MWFGHLNNLFVLVVFYIYGIGMVCGVLLIRIWHLQLLGMVLWAFVYLLVNGDVVGLILFGGIGVWALVSIAIINVQDGLWVLKSVKGGWTRDLVAIFIVLVVYGIVFGIHIWFGVNSFMGL